MPPVTPATSAIELVLQAASRIEQPAIDRIGELLEDAGALSTLSTISTPSRESENRLRLPLPELPPPEVRARLEALCDRFALDRAWLPQGRRLSDYRLIAFDMDSTLITGECIDDLAACMGCEAEVAALTAAAMQDSRIDYDTSLRRRVGLLRGLTLEQKADTYARAVHFTPGARELVGMAHRAGLKVALISGGFDYFAQRVGAELGIDFIVSNRLEMVDGIATGRMLGTLVNASFKAATLRALCEQLGVQPAQAIAVGDGANDLQMMALAGLSVGYRPKPIVREQVDVLIRQRGLDSLGLALRAA